MITVNIHDAKTQLCKLVDQAVKGVRFKGSESLKALCALKSFKGAESLNALGAL